jgi:asparagine N-glycosylation enzyme membrane subunit Stt3
MRWLLGVTDHHIAEVLFSALTMLFLTLGVKSSKQKWISFDSLRRKDWGTLKKPLIYSLLTGIANGVYLFSWAGGALFIFIILVFAILQCGRRTISKDILDEIGQIVSENTIHTCHPFYATFSKGQWGTFVPRLAGLESCICPHILPNNSTI